MSKSLEVRLGFSQKALSKRLDLPTGENSTILDLAGNGTFNAVSTTVDHVAFTIYKDIGEEYIVATHATFPGVQTFHDGLDDMVAVGIFKKEIAAITVSKAKELGIKDFTKALEYGRSLKATKQSTLHI